jgi:hypothetical protein
MQCKVCPNPITESDLIIFRAPVCSGACKVIWHNWQQGKRAKRRKANVIAINKRVERSIGNN